MINVAVIGYGYWGPNLVRNFTQNPDTFVSYVCDKDPDRLSIVKAQMPTVKTMDNYEDILKDEGLDLVAVSTPVATHYEIAKAALNKGKNVFIEKPMTTSVKEAEELIELADKKRLRIFVDHTYMFTGAVKKIKELCVKGELGDVFFFDSVRVNLGLFQKDVNVIWDLAPHDFSIMLHLIDQKPMFVSAIGERRAYDAFEDIAYITVKFEGGLIAHFHVNWMSPVKIRRIIVGASKKMVVFDDLSADEKVKIYDKGVEFISDEKNNVYNALVQYRIGDVYTPKIEAVEALRIEVAHVVDCMKTNEPSVSGGKAGLDVIRLLEATDLSLQTNGAFVAL